MLVFEFRRGRFGRFLVFLERSLGEPGSFLEPDELRRLFARHGVKGAIIQQGFFTYTFAAHRDAL